MADILHSLLEADSDKKTDDDGGDVEEEVAPGVRRVFGWMDVEHRPLGEFEMKTGAIGSIVSQLLVRAYLLRSRGVGGGSEDFAAKAAASAARCRRWRRRTNSIA